MKSTHTTLLIASMLATTVLVVVYVMRSDTENAGLENGYSTNQLDVDSRIVKENAQDILEKGREGTARSNQSIRTTEYKDAMVNTDSFLLRHREAYQVARSWGADYLRKLRQGFTPGDVVDVIADADRGEIRAMKEALALGQQCAFVRDVDLGFCEAFEGKETSARRYLHSLYQAARSGDLEARSVFWESLKSVIGTGVRPVQSPLEWLEFRNTALGYERRFILAGDADRAFLLAMDYSGRFNMVLNTEAERAIALFNVAEYLGDGRDFQTMIDLIKEGRELDPSLIEYFEGYYGGV